MPGLLDMFDPAVTQEFSVAEDERKKLLMANILMGMGAGLSNVRGNNWMAPLAGGLAYGGAMGQQAVSQAGKDKFDRFKMAAVGQEFVDKRRDREQAGRDQQELSSIFSQGPDLSQMGPGGPTVENASRIQSPKGDQYRKAAEWYAARGNTEGAKRMMDMANSFDEEYSTTPQVTRDANGKLQLVQFGKKGGAKVAQGMTPAEKLHFGSTGGQTNVGFDPYSGAVASPGLPATMTPGEVESKKLGWANYGLAANADKRAAAAAADKTVKPQWDSASGQWVFPPTPSNQTGSAVTPQGFTKPDKPLTESQSNAVMFGIRAIESDKKLTELEAGGFNPTSAGQAFNMATAGHAATNFLASDAGQHYINTGKNFVAATLRKESGAQISKEEWVQGQALYIPMPGDGPETLKQKKINRQMVVQGLKASAGHGASQIAPQQPAGGWSIVRVN